MEWVKLRLLQGRSKDSEEWRLKDWDGGRKEREIRGIERLSELWVSLDAREWKRIWVRWMGGEKVIWGDWESEGICYGFPVLKQWNRDDWNELDLRSVALDIHLHKRKLTFQNEIFLPSSGAENQLSSLPLPIPVEFHRKIADSDTIITYSTSNNTLFYCRKVN